MGHPLPPELSWKQDTKLWPIIEYEDICDYMIKSNAYDGKAMKAFRAMYGHNYVQCGWMGDVFVAVQSDVVYLKAQVSPSQPGVGKTNYMVWIATKQDGTIKTASCSCPAGLSRSCSHVAALMYTVHLAHKHGAAGEGTCTDKPVMWGKGAKHVSMEKVSSINFKKPRLESMDGDTTCISGSTHSHNFPHPLTRDELQTFQQSSPLNDIFNIPGSLIHRTLTAQPNSLLEIACLCTEHTDHTMDYNSPILQPDCPACSQFYNQSIALSSESSTALAVKTVTQDNPMWADARKIRITSSKANSIPKTSRGNPENFIKSQLYPRFRGNSATQHGVMHEDQARHQFQLETGLTVEQCGTIGDGKDPWLSASPDGLIGNDGTLEIKCPTKSLDTLITSGKYDMIQKKEVYVVRENGPNGYFTQVQIAMHCTQRQFCWFYLWSASKTISCKVPYNREFMATLLSRLRKFYFIHFLPRIVEEWQENRLTLCTAYRNLGNTN